MPTAPPDPPRVQRGGNFFRRHKLVTAIALVVFLVIILVVSGAHSSNGPGSVRSFAGLLVRPDQVFLTWRDQAKQ